MYISLNLSAGVTSLGFGSVSLMSCWVCERREEITATLHLDCLVECLVRAILQERVDLSLGGNLLDESNVLRVLGRAFAPPTPKSSQDVSPPNRNEGWREWPEGEAGQEDREEEEHGAEKPEPRYFLQTLKTTRVR